MYAAATAVTASCSTHKGSAASNRAMKTLKQVEARRMSQIKTLSQRLVKSLKRIDTESREQFVQDLRDITAAASEALLQPDEEAPTDAS